MSPAGPIQVVAQSVNVLEVKCLGRGVYGAEFGITVAAAPVHVYDAGRKSRHEGRTQTAVGQPNVRQVRSAERTAERKPAGVNYRRRENVILSQRNPLISRGHHETEVRIVALGLILKRIVNGVARKERIRSGEIVVHTHLPVILSKVVMIAASLGRPGDKRSVLRVDRPWDSWQGYNRQERSRIRTKRH